MKIFKKKVLVSLFLVVCFLMMPVSVMAEEYIIKYAGSVAADLENPEYYAMVMFKEIVEDKSEGKIKVELYPAGQLGATKEWTEGVSLGTVEMAETGYDILGLLDRICYVFTLPYLYDSLEHYIKVIEGPIGEEVNQHLIKTTGIRVLGALNRGPRHVINSVRPIRGSDDLKGLKIRSPETPLMQSTLRSMGAIPVTMTWGEVYTALSQGVADGFEGAIDTYWSEKMYEVSKILSLTQHIHVAVPIVINDKFYNELPKTYQQIISDAAKESVLWRREVLMTTESEILEELKTKYGVEVVTDVDIEGFSERAKDVWEEFVDGKIITWDLINRIKAY